MTRTRLLWLAVVVALAVLVAYQVVGSSGERRLSSSPRPTSPPSHRVSTCSQVSPKCPSGSEATTTAGLRSATPGPTTIPPPAATTAATPATTSSTATSSTRRMCQSSGVPTPLPPERFTTRTPTPPCRSCVAPRSARRCRSTTSFRSRWRGISVPATGPTRCGFGSPTIQRTCSRSTARRIRTRVTRNRRRGCRRTTAFWCQYAVQFVKCVARLRLAGRCAVCHGRCASAAATCPTG